MGAVEGKAFWSFGAAQVDGSDLQPLQIAELAAYKYGFYDLDVQDNDKGKVTIVASAAKRTVRASGKDMSDAVSNLVERFFKHE